MLRATMRIRRDPLGFLADVRDRFGDVSQFPIPRPPTYLLASAPAAAHVLVGNARKYGKQTIQYRSLSLVTGAGLLTADASAWREQRPVIQPAFHRRTLPALAAVATEESDRLADRWRAPGRRTVVDVESAILDLTLRIVGRSLFGDDLHGRSAAIAEATIAALEVVIQRARIPVAVPSGWPTPANRKLGRSLAELDAAVGRLVATRAAAPAQTPELLIDLLLAAGWPQTAVRDQVVTFLVAGHETAATGLMWALWLLAADPAHQQPTAISDDAAAAVVSEALRLFPPAWVITRQALADDEVEGRFTPAGALVVVSPFLIHRDPRYWDDPDRFDPERFAGGDRSAAYLPFGEGPRLCIGRDFAQWEMRIALRRLCAALRFERVPGEQPKPMPEVTLRPSGGMLLRVTPR
jgi:cytochrome P450